MIEITAKQLYDMYAFIEKFEDTTATYGFQTENGRYISFIKENGEYKPTTDLIIKA